MKKLLKKCLAGLAVVCLFAGMVGATDITLTVNQIVRSGLDASSAYKTSGILTTDTYKFANDGRVLIHFKKTGDGDAIITIVTPGTFHGLAVADLTVTVDATTGDQFIGPFPISLFNDASGNMQFTLDDTVSLSFVVLRL